MSDKSDIKKIIGILEEFNKEDIKIALSDLGFTGEIIARDETSLNNKKRRFNSRMGWLPDYPDIRDYTIEKDEVDPKFVALGEKDSIKEMLIKIGLKETASYNSPDVIDLRRWCSPIEDQGSIGSCTAQAGVGLIEYFERRTYNKHVDASRLFLYKTTRNLLNWTGDTGAYLRTTMGAIRLFGVPPEKYWPYNINKYDVEPDSFCYSFAQNYQAIQYYRLDTYSVTKDVLLTRIKRYLAHGVPSMFGFTVFSSISQADNDGKIPFPDSGNEVLGGHAVMAVGYDDKLKIENTSNGNKTTGAILIRNSWGRQWGNRGYGWLPYKYVLKGLAQDWWSILKNEWIDTGKFGV
jgi:C1A family cysteine protease